MSDDPLNPNLRRIGPSDLLTVLDATPKPSATPQNGWPSSSPPSTTTTATCEYCEGAGYYVERVPYGHPNFAKLLPCVCKQTEQRQRRSGLALARLGDELGGLAHCTFEAFNLARPLESIYLFGSLYLSPDKRKRLIEATRDERRRREIEEKAKEFTPDRQLVALQTALTACEAFARGPRGWLCLHGAFGAGKSHLAAAMAHERASLGEQVRYRSVPGLIDAIRAGIDDGSSNAIYTDLLECDLLVIDDLGAEHLTNWARERLFRLLNEREGRPTIITSNCHPDDLAAPDDIDIGRLMSRIVGNSRCVWLPISDYRRLRGTP